MIIAECYYEALVLLAFAGGIWLIVLAIKGLSILFYIFKEYRK